MIKNYSNILKSNRFFLFAIILLLVLVYFRSFFHGLIFLDDDTLIYTKFHGMGLAEKISFSFNSNYLDTHYYRPVTLLSVIIDSIIGGQSYFIYHFTNIIIHLLTSILIFLILRELGISGIICFFSTLVFALSPIHINAVGWIAGRGDLLAAFFAAAALLIYLKFIRQDKGYLLIFVSILLFLAILSKEVSLPVPFLFLGLYFIEKKKYELNKNSIAPIIIIIAVIGSYYLLRGLFLSSVHIDKFSFTTYYRNILVLPETVSKFFIPAGIKALAGIYGFTSIAGTILLVIMTGIPLLLKSVDKSRYYFGLFWFVILLIPGMVFRTMGQDGFYYWDCRSYLPAIGFTLMISEVLKVITAQKHLHFYYALTTVYLLILGTVTFINIRLYENPITYWKTVRADYPSSFLPYDALFNYYSFKDNTEKAEAQLVRAIELRPEVLSIRIKLFNFYERQNLPDKALALMQKTLIDDRIYSDYLVGRYIDHLLKTDRYDTNEFNKLINAYKDNTKIREKINKIARIKKNESGDSVL